MGLVNQVFAKDALDGAVDELAHTIANNAPLTLRSAKVTLQELTRPEAERDIARIRESIERCYQSKDFKEGVRAFLEKISPTTNAHKITKPLFIAQGANDPRVPASEAEQILETVKQSGGEPWYFLAMDEGHGFRKKSNRDHFGNAMSLFLEKILLEESTE